MSYPQVHVGVTGSIGTGKSTLCKMARRLKIPVFSSDKAVHELLDSDREIIRELSEKVPESFGDGKINRRVLGDWVFKSPEKIRWLERLLHPKIEEKRKAFFSHYTQKSLIVSEIPLLFEVGYEKECDIIIVTTCSFFTQKERTFRRKGMTEEKFQAILDRHIPLSEKEKKANFVISTEGTKLETFKQLRNVFQKCKVLF